MPGEIKIDDGSGNYTILTNAGSLGSDKTITIPNTTGTLATTTAKDLGGLVLLETGTASNSSELLFDDFVDLSTYPSYFIVFSRIYSQNDNVEFQVNFRTGGSSGADLTGTYYQGGVYYEADTTGGAIFENNSRTDNQVIDNNLGNGTAEAIVGSAYFYPATGTAATSNVNVIEHKTMHQRATDFMRFIHRATFHESVDATTGLKFTMSSGNISSGTIRIYGVKS